MEEKKFKFIKLIDKLKDVKERYKILRENCQALKTKRRVKRLLEKNQDSLKRQDEKYFTLCKELTKTDSKEECLEKMKEMIKKRKEIL